MAKFKLDGLDKLINRFDSMSSVADNSKEQIISRAAVTTLNQLKSDAPKKTGKSAQNLDEVNKRNGNSYLFIDVGIGKHNWQECKGLYFQHYGFKSKPKTLWMTASFKRARRKINKQIQEDLKKELNL